MNLLDFFKKDVDAVLAGLTKLVSRLEVLAEEGKKDVENLVVQLENKKADAALAEKVASNIKALITNGK